MARISFLFVLICLAAYPSRTFQQEPSIENKDLQFHVHLIARSLENEWHCSGALIYPTWILTTASCLENANKASILIGNNWNVTVNETSWFIYHGYAPVIYEHNIALIKIPKPAPAQPIEIFIPRPVAQESGASYERVGYRRESPQSAHILSSDLQSARVEPVAVSECSDFFRRDFDNHKVYCYRAVDENDRALCVGEVGAPLIVTSDEFERGLVGIYSFASSEKCFMDYPAVYTNVYVYMKWIEQAMRSYDITEGSAAIDPNPNGIDDSGTNSNKSQNKDKVDGSTKGYHPITPKAENVHNVDRSTEGYHPATSKAENQYSVDGSTKEYHFTAPASSDYDRTHIDQSSTPGYNDDPHRQQSTTPSNQNSSIISSHTTKDQQDGSLVEHGAPSVHRNYTSGNRNNPECQQNDSRGKVEPSGGRGQQNCSQGQCRNTGLQNCANGPQNNAQGCQNSQYILPGGIPRCPLSSVGQDTNFKINVSVNIQNV